VAVAVWIAHKCMVQLKPRVAWTRFMRPGTAFLSKPISVAWTRFMRPGTAFLSKPISRTHKTRPGYKLAMECDST